MNYNCPICNKAGLPDYTKSNVVCPQCNSDLKAFLLLRSVLNHRKYRMYTYSIVGISFLSVVLMGFFLNSNSDRNELIRKNEVLNEKISKLQSEIFLAKEEIEAQSIADNQDIYINYVVRKGDYPYKIAQFFYNDGRKYKQIESDNNLEQPYVLRVGQVLTIKITQDQWK